MKRFVESRCVAWIRAIARAVVSLRKRRSMEQTSLGPFAWDSRKLRPSLPSAAGPRSRNVSRCNHSLRRERRADQGLRAGSAIAVRSARALQLARRKDARGRAERYPPTLRERFATAAACEGMRRGSRCRRREGRRVASPFTMRAAPRARVGRRTISATARRGPVGRLACERLAVLAPTSQSRNAASASFDNELPRLPAPDAKVEPDLSDREGSAPAPKMR